MEFSPAPTRSIVLVCWRDNTAIANGSQVPCAAAYAALCRSGVHDLRVVTRSYSLSQLSLLKKHETMVPPLGRFQSADRLKTIILWY